MTAKTPHKIPPKPSKDTVYVDVDDEITAIIDKVETCSEKIVALVLPKRATVLQSTVNMRLLKRSADSAGKSVVLITNDPALLPLAGIAGLHTAKNLQSKPEVPPEPVRGKVSKPVESGEQEPDLDSEDNPTTLDHHRSIGELAAAHSLDEPEIIDLEDQETDKKPSGKMAKPAKDKRLKVPDFDRFRLRLLLIAGGGIALLVFLVLAISVLPKATITVKTTSVPVSAEFSLTTSDTAKALDKESKVIPAVLKTSDQTVEKQVQATGQQNNGEKATGTIRLTNCTTGSTSVTVPAGTGISASGLTYITKTSATMENSYFSGGSCTSVADSYEDVAVVAQTGGAKYNIAPTSFTVTGFSVVKASSSASMTGGSDNIIAIVAQSDLDKVKQEITSESSDTFSKSFADSLAAEGLYFLSSTLKLSDPQVSSSPAVGQPASTASVKVKVTYSALSVKKDDLTKAVTDELNKQVDKNKQKLSTNDVLEGITINVENQTSPTVVTLDISQTTTAVPIIDMAAIKKQAAGQKTSTIKSSLSSVAGVEGVEVKLSPFWVSKAPKNVAKITVVQQQAKQTDQNGANNP